MLGKTSWFQRRKYGGWGLSPKTWQGWAYIGIFIGIAALLQVIPLGGPQNNLYATIGLVAIVIIDVIDIMIHMPMDERERIHEAKAERNALWVMLTILILGTLWQAVQSSLSNVNYVDPVVIAAIAGAVITKAITNIYLDRKN